MDDRQAQFLIAVGDLCIAAGVAGLQVRVRTCDGREAIARGAPYARFRDTGAEAIDDAGFVPSFLVDDRCVDPEDVVDCTIYAPDRS